MPKGIREPLQELEGGKGFGGMGGGGGGRMPQDITISAKESRLRDMSAAEKREQALAQQRETARVADEARYRADKAAGKIKSIFPRKTDEYKKGGVTRADGCITKGHTKGRMV
jgi:hypothetical protein